MSPGKSDPLNELLTVQKRMNQLFESALARTDFDTQKGVDTWTPVCDVYEAAGSFTLCLELPGLEQERIDVRLDGDDLVVSGEREIDREGSAEQFHRVECSYGKFSRRFRLPSTVARDAVEATYRNGLLRIALPNSGHRPTDSIRVSIQ